MQNDSQEYGCGIEIYPKQNKFSCLLSKKKPQFTHRNVYKVLDPKFFNLLNLKLYLFIQRTQNKFKKNAHTNTHNSAFNQKRKKKTQKYL